MPLLKYENFHKHRSINFRTSNQFNLHSIILKIMANGYFIKFNYFFVIDQNVVQKLS